jgi:hypothetical protein
MEVIHAVASPEIVAPLDLRDVGAERDRSFLAIGRGPGRRVAERGEACPEFRQPGVTRIVAPLIVGAGDAQIETHVPQYEVGRAAELVEHRHAKRAVEQKALAQ